MTRICKIFCALSLSTSVYAQQHRLPSTFKKYSEPDDIPGMVVRYRDGCGHKYVVYAEGRNIGSDNTDTVLIEGLYFAFDGYNKPVRTKDGFYVSTGQIKQPKSKYKFYYIVYVPKTMESYSLFSYEADTKFKEYSKTVLQIIRADKAKR